jgi:hypothetical protein
VVSDEHFAYEREDVLLYVDTDVPAFSTSDASDGVAINIEDDGVT